MRILRKGDVEVESKTDAKPSIVVDQKKGLDVHVPIGGGGMMDLQSLQGLINIHFHFHSK